MSVGDPNSCIYDESDWLTGRHRKIIVSTELTGVDIDQPYDAAIARFLYSKLLGSVKDRASRDLVKIDKNRPMRFTVEVPLVRD